MYEPQTAESIDPEDLVAQTFSLFDGALNAYDSNGNVIAVSAAVDSDNGLLTFLPSGQNLAVEAYTELVSCKLGRRL